VPIAESGEAESRSEGFRTFDLSVQFYRLAVTIQLPRHLKDQLLRAASSVSLNLMEGRGKSSRKDQLRYFDIAMGSMRECSAVFALVDIEHPELHSLLDQLGGSLYLLIKRAR